MKLLAKIQRKGPTPRADEYVLTRCGGFIDSSQYAAIPLPLPKERNGSSLYVAAGEEYQLTLEFSDGEKRLLFDSFGQWIGPLPEGSVKLTRVGSTKLFMEQP